jgi:hypothetical protein
MVEYMKRQRGFAIMLIVYAVAALVIMGAIYGVYRWIDHSWETTAGIDRGKKAIQDKWDAAIVAQRKKEQESTDKATTKLETGNVKAKVVYRTIERKVDKIVARDVYRNVCADAEGVQLINAALRGPDAPAGKPDSTVPTVDGTGKRDGIGGASEADRSR